MKIKMVKSNFSLYFSILFFLTSTLILIFLSYHLCEKHLIYALDDAYIHMAVAKNFALHGVWGVTKYGFTSTSSSLIWTLLISFTYFLFGVNELSPLILNLISGILLIYTIFKLLKRENFTEKEIFLTLIAIIVLTPLYPLILSGEEHVLQILIDITFIYFAEKYLSEKVENVTFKKYLLLISPLITAVRYEGLFIILVVSVLILFLRRNIKFSFFLILTGLSPIIIYGLISIHKGWYFLPNSILIKGNKPPLNNLHDIAKYLFTWLKNILIAPQLFIVLSGIIFSTLLLIKGKEKKGVIFTIIYLPIFLLHIQFARIGWLYRYEAYLIAISIFIISIYYKKISTNKLITKNFKQIFVLFIIFCGLLLLYRGINGARKSVIATKNIYEQQYHMGLFLKKFYKGKIVALNDIGATNFLADIKCIDLFGLADNKINPKLRDYKYTCPFPYKLSIFKRRLKQKKIDIIIIFKGWFKNVIPENWVEVGKWKIKNNVVCGQNKVTFFATDPQKAKILIENLKKFKNKLPKDVIQSGTYLDLTSRDK